MDIIGKNLRNLTATPRRVYVVLHRWVSCKWRDNEGETNKWQRIGLILDEVKSQEPDIFFVGFFVIDRERKECIM